MTATAVDNETQILDLLDFPSEDTCDYRGCLEVATHQVICRCKKGAENICAEHTAMLHAHPLFVLVFDGTCGHTVRVKDCTIVAL